MQVVNGKLVLGRKDCGHCDKGTVATKAPCQTCKGTGNGKRGGKRSCRPCYGAGYVWDHDRRATCDHCGGNYRDAEPESVTDYLPPDVFPSLSFEVYRNATMTTAESLLGMGCVFSCGDYGEATRQSDADLIADVKSHGSVQACKIAKDDGTLCAHVGIFVTQNGYKVQAVF